MVLGHQVYNYHDAVDDIHRFLKVIVPATCDATSLAKIGHTEARAALFAACERQRLLSTMSALQVMKLDGCTSAPLINRAKVGFQVLSFRSQWLPRQSVVVVVVVVVVVIIVVVSLLLLLLLLLLM